MAGGHPHGCHNIVKETSNLKQKWSDSVKAANRI